MASPPDRMFNVRMLFGSGTRCVGTSANWTKQCTKPLATRDCDAADDLVASIEDRLGSGQTGLATRYLKDLAALRLCKAFHRPQAAMYAAVWTQVIEAVYRGDAKEGKVEGGTTYVYNDNRTVQVGETSTKLVRAAKSRRLSSDDEAEVVAPDSPLISPMSKPPKPEIRARSWEEEFVEISPVSLPPSPSAEKHRSPPKSILTKRKQKEEPATRRRTSSAVSFASLRSSDSSMLGKKRRRLASGAATRHEEPGEDFFWCSLCLETHSLKERHIQDPNCGSRFCQPGLESHMRAKELRGEANMFECPNGCKTTAVEDFKVFEGWGLTVLA